ncbi:MAG: HD domain-containing protein [Candidatus Helarchaeota archaeon]
MNNDKINKAIKFAKEKHKNQRRKYGLREPYVEHPFRVVIILKNYTDDEDTIIAAYLHDTIEDTKTTYNEILNEFGIRVANFVNELTSDKRKASEMGKAAYLVEKMNKMSGSAFLIKLCDRLDNVSGLSIESSDFVQRYVDETKRILNNLKRDFSKDQKELIEKIREKIELRIKA